MSQDKNRIRNIPWPDVVKFHKEIAARAETSFFSFFAKDFKDERWTSLENFNFDNLTGPWKLNKKDIVSNPFKLSLEQNSHDSLFIGGPCYLGWEKGTKGGWIPQWRPLIYREIKIEINGDTINVIPEQGHWYFSPLICNTIDRLNVSITDDFDLFAKKIVEAANSVKEDNQSIGEAIKETLIAKIPDLEEVLKKDAKNDLEIIPSEWVLFAPTSNFSALTRHLMADYNRLENILSKDPKNVGGFEVLDGVNDSKEEKLKILPVTLLNKAQKIAVENILSLKNLSVISGPPGCGKSQVVVSVLLNAWANGKSVLFASNNNSAVDVVRERLEKFESEFPVAVRAGNRQKNNVVELLRRALNYANNSIDTEDHFNENEAKRRKLTKKRRELESRLEGKLPQRADEGLKTALNAYGEYKKLNEEVEKKDKEIKDLWVKCGYENKSLEHIIESSKEIEEWIAKHKHYKKLQKEDFNKLKEFEHSLNILLRTRSDNLINVGLEDSEISNWDWLIKGPSHQLINEWETNFQEILNSSVEESLEPYEWDASFERWESDDQALSTSKQAKDNSSYLRTSLAEISPKVKQTAKLRKQLDENVSILETNGLECNKDIDLDVLINWGSFYSELLSRNSTKFDFLPWSDYSRIIRRLKNLEIKIRGYIPINKLKEIGEFNSKDGSGRDKLSNSIEQLRHWKLSLDDWDNQSAERDLIEKSFEKMRADSAQLLLNDIPNDENEDSWNSIIKQSEDLSKFAKLASNQIKKKHAQEEAINLISTIVKKWKSLASGHPIKESWSEGPGKKFIEKLNNLATKPSPKTVIEIRKIYYSGNLNEFKNVWEEATDIQFKIEEIENKIECIDKPTERVAQWYSEMPNEDCFSLEQTEDWPDFSSIQTKLDYVKKVCDDYLDLENNIKPKSRKDSINEYNWANDQLSKAIDILPNSSAKDELKEIHDKILNKELEEWPTDEISRTFEEFSTDIIRAKISQIDIELEKGSFEDSKALWIKRLKEDDEAINAIDQLEKILRKKNNKIYEEHYDIFVKSLRLVPIWVATAQAAQSIPLIPKLFDLVIIDEASQCTVTNLLPLLYRGKRLAIIGDHQQLPAIPTVQESEELTLAKKFNLEPFLNVIGHSNNDVYSCAADTLPRGRAGVLNLDEHFRSNPQIIGFSNRHIYQQRLRLKTDPSKDRTMPVGSGVHKVSVRGKAMRGDKGKSWVNTEESEKVIELIKELSSNKEMRHYSIGVVTPFSAQKELLRNKIDALGLASKILVDSAYGFQGDERDIMIFSPVVANGITSSASRWVESPPNLINVALTRARQVLYVVADFEYCLSQDPSGILNKLAKYCNSIEILRETSPAELELYSWMIVEGWNPGIHEVIGDCEVDFTLVSNEGIRLVIEVDGSQHEQEQTTDNSRDITLRAKGWRVLRIKAREVLETPHNVIEKIKQNLE